MTIDEQPRAVAVTQLADRVAGTVDAHGFEAESLHRVDDERDGVAFATRDARCRRKRNRQINEGVVVHGREGHGLPLGVEHRVPLPGIGELDAASERRNEWGTFAVDDREHGVPRRCGQP